MSLGEKIKRARLEAGLSQRQLCGDTITRNMLSQIENGSARPSMDTLSHFARQLGKPISWFLEEAGSDPDRQAMEQARQAYLDGHYNAVLTHLQQRRQVLDTWEGQLLQALSLVELAKAALEQGKPVYAVSLLEQAWQTGEQTPYFTPALRREWSLIMYSAQPRQAQQLAEELPEDPRELCLRARAAMDLQDYGAAARLLDAVQRKDNHWHFLRGQAALGQKDYALAAQHYRLAEADYPIPCARALEQCYRELEDYKLAYYYACKQREES